MQLKQAFTTILFLSIYFINNSSAQDFTEKIFQGIPNISQGDIAWVDVDTDGDKDLFITGWDGAAPITRLYLNDGSDNLQVVNNALINLYKSTVDWADYDADGDSDFAISGIDVNNKPQSRIYRNDGDGVFTDIQAPLVNLADGSLQWGDFDLDADIDLLVTGIDENEAPRTIIYTYDGVDDFNFSLLSDKIIGVKNGDAKWVDLDKDSDLDIILMGESVTGEKTFKKYFFKEGDYLDGELPLLGYSPSAMDWADYDNDGDQDIALMGLDKNSMNVSKILENINNEKFVETDIELGVTISENIIAWGDQNNDNLPELFQGYLNIFGEYKYVLYQNEGNGILTETEFPAPGFDAPLKAEWKDVDQNGWQDLILYGAKDFVDGQLSEFAAFEIYYNDGGTFTKKEFSTPLDIYSTDWADYDNDGDLDFAAYGWLSCTAGCNYRTTIYRNDNNESFTDLNPTFVNSFDGDVSWGDYDNDGDKDVLISGFVLCCLSKTLVLENNNNEFSEVEIPVRQLYGTTEFVDLDNDGDDDIIQAGQESPPFPLPSSNFAGVYRNDDGVFTEVEGLNFDHQDNFTKFSVNDFDNDGDKDLLLIPFFADGTSGFEPLLYQNEGGMVFTKALISDFLASKGALNVGNFNNDTNLDILITGENQDNEIISQLYSLDNTGGLTLLSDSFTGLINADSKIGDLDDDGDADILLLGEDENSNSLTKVYLNDGNANFNLSSLSLPQVKEGQSSFSDYDDDGDLDISVIGSNQDGTLITAFYTNNISSGNAPPSIPDNLNVEIVGNTISFSWSPVADVSTGTNEITYDILLKKNGNTILSPNISLANETLIEQSGVVITDTAYQLTLNEGSYSFSVQAKDNSFLTSGFSNEFEFTVADQLITANFLVQKIPEIRQRQVFNYTRWGDYDNDGDMDLLFFAETFEEENGNPNKFSLYKNNGANNFEEVFSDFNFITIAQLRDYDADGDLDILIGPSDNGVIIYRNDGNDIFEEINPDFEGFIYSFQKAFEWVDLDGDADLDVLIINEAAENSGVFEDKETAIYINQGNDRFSKASDNLLGVLPNGGLIKNVVFEDIDRDGDQDFLISHLSSNFFFNAVSKPQIYLNEGDFTFTRIDLSIEKQMGVNWVMGDYNNDGIIDLADDTGEIWKGLGNWEYESLATSFGFTNPFVIGKSYFIDFDNDGDQDLIGGENLSNYLLVNEGSDVFSFKSSFIQGYSGTSAYDFAWADYDNDGDLDFISDDIIYKNLTQLKNNVPEPPVNLSQSVLDKQVTLSWDAGSDSETPVENLTYNVKISNESGVFLQSESFANGERLIPKAGNAGAVTSMVLDNLPNGQYTWSVQTVDLGFEGSEFSEEATFTVNNFEELPTSNTPQFLNYYVVGDYDNDKDLDLFFTEGSLLRGNQSTGILRNDGDFNFTQVDIGVAFGEYSTMKWGDYDNDGDLDIVFAGQEELDLVNGVINSTTKIYKNQGNDTFELIENTAFTGIHSGDVSWIDYDNDGDLDLFINGDTNTKLQYGFGNEPIMVAELHRNNGNDQFEKIPIPNFTPTMEGRINWADFDKDGDLDLMSTGWEVYLSNGHSTIYKNDGGNFSVVNTDLPSDIFFNFFLHDYDSDGDYDLFFANNGVYENKGDFVFENIGIDNLNFFGIGDLDNDGDPDGIAGVQHMYLKETGSGFKKSIVSSNMTNTVLGDFNNDGSLDVLSRFFNYKNLISKKNTLPTSPINLSSVVSDDVVTLSWDDAFDEETVPIALSYNVEIRKGNEIILSANSHEDGYRKIYKEGNAGVNNFKIIKNLKGGAYHWKVQAIDNNFAGGVFSLEGSFEINIYDEFTDNLEGVAYHQKAWGDYDSDGDLDLVMYSENKTTIYNQDTNNEFNIVQDDLPGFNNGAAVWFDYNNDGALDILLSGGLNTSIYQNQNGVFVLLNPDFVGLDSTSLATGDFDNDGDQDFFISGKDQSENIISGFYINENNSFSFASLPGSGIINGKAIANDYDSDGDLDLILTGSEKSSIYRNNGSLDFSDGNAPLRNVSNGSIAVGDYNSDGNPDIILTGKDVISGELITRLYQNDGGEKLLENDLGNFGIENGNIEWGDCDADGDLDFIIAGEGMETTIMLNQDGNFSPYSINYESLLTGSVSWADIDNDNDLDFIISGKASSSQSISKVYLNNQSAINTLSEIPGNLVTEINENSAILNWDTGSDFETLTNGLSYNIYLRTGNDIIVQSNSLSNGDRKIVETGNTGQIDFFKVINLDDGVYHWSVQTIDNNFSGSEFASEETFTICFAKSQEPIDFMFDENIGTGAIINFNAITSSTSNSTWQWDFDDGTTSNDLNTTHTFSQSGDYNVSLTETTDIGCINTISKEVQVKDIVPVRVATLMTPNGDGKNDILYIENIERYPENEIRILNSWGQELYFARGYNNDWDGTYNGQVLAAGSYICILKVDQFATEKKHVFSIVK